MPFSYALTLPRVNRFGFQSYVASSMQCYVYSNIPGFPAAPVRSVQWYSEIDVSFLSQN